MKGRLNDGLYHNILIVTSSVNHNGFHLRITSIILSIQVPFCNPMKVASSVENIWVPDIDSGERKELVDSLWLSSGATGMKVWLTLSTQVIIWCPSSDSYCGISGSSNSAQ